MALFALQKAIRITHYTHGCPGDLKYGFQTPTRSDKHVCIFSDVYNVALSASAGQSQHPMREGKERLLHQDMVHVVYLWNQHFC